MRFVGAGPELATREAAKPLTPFAAQVRRIGAGKCCESASFAARLV
jgi:hypothetical protein